MNIQKFILGVIISFITCQKNFSQNLVINEVLASNLSINADEDNTPQDWIEIYNGTTQAINLNGFGLTDDVNLPYKWIFPNVTISSGQYLLIWASDKNRTNPLNPLHTNFKISAGGETLKLTNSSGTIVDMVVLPAQTDNISYGRSPNATGDFAFFQTPTPASFNSGTGASEVLSAPQFSQNSGFYTTGFNLSITTNESGATIIYTLDGSDPLETNLSGTVYNYKNQYPKLPGQAFGSFLTQSFQTLNYSSPIAISDRSSMPNKIANISSTYDFSPPYFPNNPILKATVVRARVVKPGALPSPIVTRTYFVNPLGSSLFTIPVISISTSENNFFDYNNGIYVAGVDFDTWRTNYPFGDADYEIGNFARKGTSSERPINFSYFVNGNEVLNQNIGARIRGNYSRIYPSKSFNLYARSDYGDDDMDFSFFQGLPYNSYERLSLKNSSGDFYHTLFRDPLNHELIKGLNVETEAYQPTVTFINGEYWGILSLRDKYDEKYFKRVYNIEEDQIDVLENNADVEEGDDEDYLEMIEYLETNSLAQDEHYNYIKTQLDEDNFKDYFISNIYFQNVDWPGNNIIYWRKKTQNYEPNAPYGHDGRWRWAIHDMDSSFGISSGDIALNTLALATAENGPDWPNPEWSTLILRRLLENNSFKNDFINRFADLMNTYFKTDRVVAKINAMKTVLQPEMPKQFERWKAPVDFGDWNYFLNEEIAFAQQRPGYQRQHIKDEFGISNTINTVLNVSNENHGYVKINTIDILATTPGVESNPYPWTGIYFANIPVKLKAVAKEGYVFSHWEGFSNSTEAEITITTDQNFNITAVFIPEGFSTDPEEPIYFWMFDGDLQNNTPLSSISSTFEMNQNGVLSYQSCLAGYPFNSSHPSWRKASMERRNNPTSINYLPTANDNIPFASSDMKGIQIKQPFQNNGNENTLYFSFSTLGYQQIKFAFAAMNENAADNLVIDYAINNGSPTWITSGMPIQVFPLTNSYQKFEVDLSSIDEVNNNPNLKIRIRFTGSNMTVDNGNRVNFNNFSLTGKRIPLTYPTPHVLVIGQTITDIVPTLTATADSFSISPSLPNGLNFDTATGIISGTPTVLQSPTDYEVTATNSGGSTSFTLSIEIIDAAPSSLSYSTPNVFIINQSITDLVPTVSGENLTFSINPSLPNGLTFDTLTGIISGTPMALQSATDYEVTATNSGGSTSFTLSIEVIDVAPNGLSYSTPNVFTINQSITDLVPTVSGENLTFSINPSLPNGLTFDTLTGIISGTPMALQSATDYEVTATNSGGSTSFTLSIEVIDVAPNGLSYSTPNVFTINQSITDLVPTVSGENLTFSINPSLPNGLTFDTLTGIISGTPMALQSATDYEVTATNSGGSTSFTLSIEVIDVAPNGLSYSTPNVFTINQSITDLVPTVSGENLTFSISPSLPSGLSFNTVTGIISGTPMALQSATDYEVTATNSGGSTSFTLSIEVIDVAPNGLSYSTPNVFTINQSITDLVPTVSGENLTFSISPSLPSGLSFNTVTGVISGTPIALQSATDYEVTATNSGGSTSFTLSIEVIDAAPTNLSYSTPNIFTINQSITDLAPTVSGENLTFSISPSLPTGLTFDTATGIISGTPTILQSPTDYEVTATNSGGSTSFTLSIEVIDFAPNGLSYSTPNVFTINQSITDLVPTVSGENLTFSISPSLPSGLSFNTVTGIISGTPMALQSATDYEVTATNSGGSTSFTLSIEVIDVAPNGLSYSTPNVFTINQSITDLVPTVSGENLTFSISPSLPSGLSFNTVTGVISGTPIALQSATDYEVTATNSGGSTSFTLSIEVIDAAPTNLSYSTPNIFTINQSITDLAPTVSGENLTFSISPSLPTGLTFDTATGIISGTPTILQSPTDYEVTATNSGGSTSFTLSIEIIDVAPTNLSYSTPNVFIINQSITDLVPTVSGENLTFSINPSLPNGLTFDTLTGIISGTPMALQSATDYEVTATNSGGSVSFVLSIEIIDAAPSSLSYATPNVSTVDEAIANLVPTVSGENLVFSIVPSLPNGLTFDTLTGIISGTPTVLQSATDYEVTATNSGGSTSFTLSIEVIDVAPTNLSYATPNVFTINQSITDLVPTVSGENLTFSISPSLPTGLSFNTVTGVISGTPTDLQLPTDYEVTATNSGGSTSFTLSIEIIDAAPSSLSYSTPNVFTINQLITDLAPTVSGENLVFSIVPSLPTGLSFNTVTGVISGTPTDLQLPTDYEVTATNSGGSTSFTLSIEIIDAAPSSLSYSTPNVFTINQSITDLAPTVSGENLVFSIVPSLPNGLSFDTLTGIISGTPTDLQLPTDYEVTATNSGGSTSFTLSIEIIDAAPINLSYATPNVFTINQLITDLAPTVSGENMTFSINPSLPTGLSFDTATGIISGTPTILQSPTDYEVTATNSGGSTSFTLSIEVIDAAPINLSYATPNVFTINQLITDLAPTVSGENLTFSINPSLPTGLSFETATGVISGTPTALQSPTDYEITATNSGGSVSFVVSIAVEDELGIIDDEKNLFVVFPNPFTNEINVNHNFVEVAYSIFSLDGKEIQSGRLLNSKIMVNDLPSSVYLLKLQSEEKVQLIKLVKQ